MARNPLNRSELATLAARSDAQEALCRRLAAETRLSIYTTFANRHAAKAARKRTLASLTPARVSSKEPNEAQVSLNPNPSRSLPDPGT